MRRIFIVLGFILFVLMIIVYGFRNNSADSKVTINSATFSVTIAKTPEEQIKGLSGVTGMPEDHGMLFVFDKPGHHSFWMHGMKFSLDIIFISQDKVVGVYENLPPAKDEDVNPTLWGGNVLSDRVLETNAGMAKKNNIKVGDKIFFKL